MGTNFYLVESKKTSKSRKEPDGEERGLHIGKRSAAGWYCWDCDVSLTEGRVHSGKALVLDRCPYCHEQPKKEELGSSSAGRELGFNKNEPQRKTGVRSCSSFTWALTLEKFFKLKGDIKDEYDRVYTRAEFLEMLDECPLMFFSIGREFS